MVNEQRPEKRKGGEQTGRDRQTETERETDRQRREKRRVVNRDRQEK